jgi:hypothetical protein
MLFKRPGGDEDVQVGETEVEFSQNVVYEALECVGGVVQSEGHEGELDLAEWSGDGSFLYIVRMNGNLIVRTHQVDLGEDGTTEKLVRVVMDMTDGIAVGDGPG